MQISVCSGCGKYNIEPLGVNRNGEPFMACCPDSSYNEVETVLTRFFFEFIDLVAKRLPSKNDAESFVKNKQYAPGEQALDEKSFMEGAIWVSNEFDKAMEVNGESEVNELIVRYLNEEKELRGKVFMDGYDEGLYDQKNK